MERNNVRLSGNVQNVGNNTRFEKIALSNEDMEYIGSSGAISVFFFSLFPCCQFLFFHLSSRIVSFSGGVGDR